MVSISGFRVFFRSSKNVFSLAVLVCEVNSAFPQLGGGGGGG